MPQRLCMSYLFCYYYLHLIMETKNLLYLCTPLTPNTFCSDLPWYDTRQCIGGKLELKTCLSWWSNKSYDERRTTFILSDPITITHVEIPQMQEHPLLLPSATTAVVVAIIVITSSTSKSKSQAHERSACTRFVNYLLNTKECPWLTSKGSFLRLQFENVATFIMVLNYDYAFEFTQHRRVISSL